MNRPIKFRAWDKKVKHMFFWSLTEVLETFIPRTGDLDWMQFTGLLDKNGKEIYEGDIVKAKNVHYLYAHQEHNQDWGVIEWWDAEGGWVVDDNKGDRYARIVGSESGNDGEIGSKCVEVVGNIYENPELLK